PRSTAVRVAAVPLVGCHTPAAVEKLAPLLEDHDSAVRVAAASALAGCSAHEAVAGLFMTALERPEARDADREELIALYRALGRLGTDAGFDCLVGRLPGGRRKLFNRPTEADRPAA